MKTEFTEKELKLLNKRKTILAMLDSERINPTKAIRTAKYERRIKELQIELLKLQKWVTETQQKVVILFEGRDAAGKGGAIRRFVEHLNPREYRIVALPKPDEVEAGQWYFQRYINQFPQKGEIVLFDRSWYNRAIVEPVNGFCTKKQYENFMDQVNAVEKMMLQSDIHLVKMYFSITKKEQERRFNDIKNSPLKKWKFSKVDERAQELWDEYTKYKVEMFEKTQEHIPWKVIKANRKTNARIAAMEYVLAQIPYQTENDEFSTVKPNE